LRFATLILFAAASGLGGEAIYNHALAVLRAARQPPYVVYRVDYRGHNAFVRCDGGITKVSFDLGDQTASFRVAYRASDGRAVSINLQSNHRCGGTPLMTPSGGDLAALVRSTPPPAEAPSLDRSAPRTIGDVRVASVLYYRVLSVQDEDLDGHPCHHLKLQAYSNPDVYPLTDLWVDAGSFAIRRVGGDFADRYSGAPARTVATGSFEAVGEYWLLDRERIVFTAATRPHPIAATLDAEARDFTFPENTPPELNGQ
jgi:hypothetical protein